MMPLFLLATAFGITAVALILLFWRYADRRIQEAYPDESQADLQKMLADALEQQALLTERVEHLETIIASETWDTRQKEQATLPLALPDASPEEQARRRQRSR